MVGAGAGATGAAQTLIHVAGTAGPAKPGRQEHEKEPTPSWQEPPFRQGSKVRREKAWSYT